MMELFLIIGIGVGIGLDYYAKSVCQGALLSNIKMGRLGFGFGIFGIIQFLILMAGYYLAVWLHKINIADREDEINYFISILIFTCLAVRMLYFAFRNESILEVRRGDSYFVKMFFLLILPTGITAFLSGIGLGMGLFASLKKLILFALIGLLGVASGLYSGYHLGYQPKTAAYAVGGICLLSMAVTIGITYLA